MEKKRWLVVAVGSLAATALVAIIVALWPSYREVMIRRHLAAIDAAVQASDNAATEQHRDKLLRLGYFERRNFSVRGQPGFIEALIARADARPVVTWSPRPSGDWSVTVTAPAEAMADWVEFIDGWNEER